MGDVRVVQRREDLRLPLESGQAIGIGGERLGEDLQGDLAVEFGVGGLRGLPHPTLADEGGHVVVPEAGAGFERYGWSRLVSTDPPLTAAGCAFDVACQQ